MKKAVNSEDYENISYDVELLFTNIPVKETIKYILHKIYADKSIKPYSKMSIFKKLLVKLTKECLFSVNSCLIKQTDRCLMGGHVKTFSSWPFYNKQYER